MNRSLPEILLPESGMKSETLIHPEHLLMLRGLWSFPFFLSVALPFPIFEFLPMWMRRYYFRSCSDPWHERSLTLCQWRSHRLLVLT